MMPRRDVLKRPLNLSEAIITEFARLRAFLRRRGQGIPDLDLLIAATVLVHEPALVTRGRRHFARTSGLRLYRSS